MRRLATVLIVAIAIIAVWRLPITIETLCELEQCPRLCYSLDFCDSIKHVRLRYESITDLANMLLGTKGTYHAWYNESKVILKKLSKETSTFNLKTCAGNDSNLIYDRIHPRFDLVTDINHLNPEPFVLDLFKADADWPLPRMVGMCGTLLVQTDCGRPLVEYADSPWPIRAKLAAQLLQSAVDFTQSHAQFRLYLTDVSGDNVVVDKHDRIHFVDLEHVILTEKKDGLPLHESEFIHNDYGFSYSEEEICASGFSDHNIYAVCYLLLWQQAPWPMFPGGLLYDAKMPIIQEEIEKCVKYGDRFRTASKLLRLLRD